MSLVRRLAPPVGLHYWGICERCVRDTWKFNIALFGKRGSTHRINISKSKEGGFERERKNRSNLLQLFRNLFLIISHWYANYNVRLSVPSFQERPNIPRCTAGRNKTVFLSKNALFRLFFSLIKTSEFFDPTWSSYLVSTLLADSGVLTGHSLVIPGIGSLNTC